MSANERNARKARRVSRSARRTTEASEAAEETFALVALLVNCMIVVPGMQAVGLRRNHQSRGSFTHVHKSGHMSRMNSSKSSNEDRRAVHIVGSPAETCLYTSCVQTRSDASNYLTRKTRHYSTRDSRGTIAVRHITVPPSARRRHNFSAQGVVLNENR